jgi:hypothetical protein
MKLIVVRATSICSIKSRMVCNRRVASHTFTLWRTVRRRSLHLYQHIQIVAYFPKVSLCDFFPVCVFCVPHHLLNDWTSIKLGAFAMAPEPISTVYFINPSHQSVSCVCCRATAQKRRHHSNKYTRSNRRIVGRVVFCTIHVVSKVSRQLVIPKNFVFNIRFPLTRSTPIATSAFSILHSTLNAFVLWHSLLYYALCIEIILNHVLSSE